MSFIEPGIQGAKRASFRQANPRELLLGIMEKHPRADERGLFKALEDALDKNPEMDRTVRFHWFTNTLNSIRDERSGRRRRAALEPKAREAREKQDAEVVATIKARSTAMVLLDWSLPNGKRLRDSTGKDCAKVGGWLAKVAERVKPTQRVGDALSESEVREIFRNAP